MPRSSEQSLLGFLQPHHGHPALQNKQKQMHHFLPDICLRRRPSSHIGFLFSILLCFCFLFLRCAILLALFCTQCCFNWFQCCFGLLINIGNNIRGFCFLFIGRAIGLGLYNWCRFKCFLCFINYIWGFCWCRFNCFLCFISNICFFYR